MIGKVRVLGVTFIITMALSAAVAQAGQFDIGSGPAVLKGQSDPAAIGFQEHVFTFYSGVTPFNAICGSASFEGTTAGIEVLEATLTPTYSSCKLAGINATVQMNGCKYTLTGSGYAARTFSIDIVGCTAGKQIQIKSVICTVDIPEQTLLYHLVATNVAGGVTLEATLSGLLATLTGAACPGGNGAPAFASISGNTIVKAFKDLSGPKVTKHGHEYIETIGGEQVSLVVT